MWTSFIGFMASGKSAVTSHLQGATSRPAVSVDVLVTEKAGRSIPDIFAQDGEPAFRRREVLALESLDGQRPLLVDTGGGIVESPEAVELLRDRGVVIWLDAPWETIRARLKQSDLDARPLVGRLGWDGLEDLYHRRRRLYAGAADFRLWASGGTVAEVARTSMLRSLIWERRQTGRL
jgi:shikimate kinase|nr:shikimate kinase [Candidatus Krumholzibacteria bacterium]